MVEKNGTEDGDLDIDETAPASAKNAVGWAARPGPYAAGLDAVASLVELRHKFHVHRGFSGVASELRYPATAFGVAGNQNPKESKFVESDPSQSARRMGRPGRVEKSFSRLPQTYVRG